MTKVSLRNNDVLFGRGYAISAHPGNQILRCMVRAHKPLFARTIKTEKRDIARKIVNDIQYRLGGRFLIDAELNGDGGDGAKKSRRNDREGIYEKAWACVETEKAVSKVMHRLREKDSKGIENDDDDDPQVLLEQIERQLQQIDRLREKRSFDQSAGHVVQGQIVGGTAGLPTSAGDLVAFPNSAAPGTFLSSFLLNMQRIDNFDLEPIGCPNLPVETFANGINSQQQAFGNGFIDLSQRNLPENNNVWRSATSEPMVCQPNQHMDPPPTSQSNLCQPPSDLSSLSFGESGAATQILNGHTAKILSTDNSTNLHTGSPEPNNYLLPQPLNPSQSNGASAAAAKLSTESSKMGNRNIFFLEANVPALSFPISVAEFVKLGGLSNRLVLMQDEDGVRNIARAVGPQSVGPLAVKTSGETAEQKGSIDDSRLALENAARMALLLTQSFVGHLSEIQLDSIQLDDFSIYSNQEICQEQFKEPVSRTGVPEWVLLGIDISPSKTIHGARQKPNELEANAMMLLGKLLYPLFSLGESLSPVLLTKPSASSQGGSITSTRNVQGRSAKVIRALESTLFSRLIESNVFPVSVCRLISDMVDTGRASSRIRFFDDVIQDLEQMVKKPLTFLHDAPLPSGGLLQPAFGQTYHGRGEEVATLRNAIVQVEQSLNQVRAGSVNNSGCIKATFVSGIAGSGKSHLIQTVQETLGSEWIHTKAKFERDKEHVSRRIVSTMFDRLIVDLVKMKESGSPSDAAYVRRVSKSIYDAIGYSRLSLLVDFLPSLFSLFDGLGGSGGATHMQAEDKEFRLIYSITKIIEALLQQDRLVMICCDDLQWADKTSLSLLSEILVNIGSMKHICSRCLFVGLFRDDEINDEHPFTIQYTYLRMMISNIDTTEIKLSSLSKRDIGDMLMAELRLPRRYVTQLADVVHKKTSGHSIFVVELLNSLVRSSVIAYSPQNRRYSWDQDTVNIIQTGVGVAGLIASNLKSLPPASLRVLQILSCFGIQTDISLLRYLEKHEDGIICCLDAFIELGILDRAGPIVIFTHDMIQQEVYESTPLAQRQMLHLRIGQCLGEYANTISPSTVEPVVASMDHLRLDDRQEFYAGKNLTSSLISIACDQIDLAGPDAVVDEAQRVTFSEWNMSAGWMAHQQSDPRAALYYFSNGISFLGQDCWHSSYANLCLTLHKGAVMASFMLGESDEIARFSDEVMAHTEFKDSLEIQPFILRSLSQAGRHEECVSRGVQILCQLKFDIPLAPTPESVMKAMASTDGVASKFSADEMMNLCEKAIDDSVHRAIGIIDAFYCSCYVSSSPFLPLVCCAVIQFSLEHGICPESLAAFATFGGLKVFLTEDYAGGRHWGEMVRMMANKLEGITKSKLNDSHAHVLLHIAVDIWFRPLIEISQNLDAYHNTAMKNGQLFMAMVAQGISCRYLLLGGHNLSLLKQSYGDKLRLVAKHSKFVAKYLALDSLLLTELTGESEDYFSVFGGLISNMKDLQDEAKSNKDLTLLQSSHVFSVLLEYWRGNYLAAEEHSHLASMLYPACKEPTVYLIYHTFFRALVLFKLYRVAGSGNQRLKDGKEMVDVMGKWALVSTPVFENKWLLLKAEYFASVEKLDEALQMYEGSIKSARDRGNIHELALAHELLGNYYLDRGCHVDSVECFKRAHVYYTQWGATTVADRILLQHNLNGDSACERDLNIQNRKQSRRWE